MFLQINNKTTSIFNYSFLVLLYLIPSPYEFINFPFENNVNFIIFILILFILKNSRKSRYIVFLTIIFIKIYGLTSIENHYSVCLKSDNNISSECENTFNQYSFIPTSKSYKINHIDFGVNNDQKTFHGHADSNWKTEYITGLESYASKGSIHFRWKPFSVEIDKLFKTNTKLSITYFGELKIYSEKKLIFYDYNYKEIKQYNIEVPKNKNIYIEYQYRNENLDNYILRSTSEFNKIEKQHFATLRIKEIDNLNYLLYSFYFLITFIFFNLKFVKFYLRDLIINKENRLKFLLLFLANTLIYFYFRIPVLVSIVVSILLIALNLNHKSKLFTLQLLIAPVQILKFFDIVTYSLPRLPGTVPHHHQVMALAMNSPVSITNFLRGGDNIFYEPPLFRYLLYFLNLFFGSNWILVSILFLFISIRLVIKIFEKPHTIITSVIVFIIILIIFSSGFLNLLLQGWSEPFFILLILFSLFDLKQNRKISHRFLLVLCLAVLIRPESILYLAIYFLGSLKIAKKENNKIFVILIIFILPLIHNIYFGNNFLLISSAGNELGFIDILSNDKAAPLETTLGNNFTVSKLLAIFFYPLNETSLLYVGTGFLLINLILLLATVINISLSKYKITHLFLALMSFAPYLLYDIYDGYPRRSLALTTANIIINGLISLGRDNLIEKNKKVSKKQ